MQYPYEVQFKTGSGFTCWPCKTQKLARLIISKYGASRPGRVVKTISEKHLNPRKIIMAFDGNGVIKKVKGKEFNIGHWREVKHLYGSFISKAKNP